MCHLLRSVSNVPFYHSSWINHSTVIKFQDNLPTLVNSLQVLFHIFSNHTFGMSHKYSQTWNINKHTERGGVGEKGFCTQYFPDKSAMQPLFSKLQVLLQNLILYILLSSHISLFIWSLIPVVLLLMAAPTDFWKGCKYFQLFTKIIRFSEALG